jgi:hypothetical protein
MKNDQLHSLSHNTPIAYNPNDLNFKEPFLSLFKRDEKRISQIAESMKPHNNGYDSATPIICIEIEGKLYVVRGHHRTLAARIAGIDVIIIIKDYESEFAAYLDAVHEQGSSRIFNNAELFQCVITSDSTIKYKKGAKLGNVAQQIGNRGQLKKHLALTFRISEKTIQKCFTIIDSGSEDQKKEVLESEKAKINKVYNEIIKNNKPVIKKIESKYKIDFKNDDLYLILGESGTRILSINPKLHHGVIEKQFRAFIKKLPELAKEYFK